MITNLTLLKYRRNSFAWGRYIKFEVVDCCERVFWGLKWAYDSITPSTIGIRPWNFNKCGGGEIKFEVKPSKLTVVDHYCVCVSKLDCVCLLCRTENRQFPVLSRMMIILWCCLWQQELTPVVAPRVCIISWLTFLGAFQRCPFCLQYGLSIWLL